MAEHDGTMTATFEAPPDLMKLLMGQGVEYVVEDPWEGIRWCLKDGTVKERKQDIRERVTRCRDCRYHAGVFCKLHEVLLPDPSEDDGFCAWASPREVG